MSFQESQHEIAEEKAKVGTRARGKGRFGIKRTYYFRFFIGEKVWVSFRWYEKEAGRDQAFAKYRREGRFTVEKVDR